MHVRSMFLLPPNNSAPNSSPQDLRRLAPEPVHLHSQTQKQLGSCLSALALHLGSRLDALLGKRPPAATPSGASAVQSQDRHCEWLKEGASQLHGLPVFPEIPQMFELPPLPRLLPSWQQLHSLTRPPIMLDAAKEHASQSVPQPPGLQQPQLGQHRRTSAFSRDHLLFGIGTGVSIGLLLVLFSRRCR